MKNILVTGGTGFIGSHTCVELIENKYNVIIIDNLSNSEIGVLDKIEEITGVKPKFYQDDLLDEAAVKKIFDENKIDAVIHFAGLKAVGESVEKPIEYYYNNIVGTLNLCRVMRQAGCKKIVFSSSATVYGMHNTVPFREDASLSATNPYGYTKLMQEQMFTDICNSDSEWSVVLLRYFNPIGAHQSGLIGENPAGIPNNLVPYVARVAVGKLPHLNVFGGDYDTHDGTGVRDYIHVVDLAQGHLRALEYAFENAGAEAINLGTGKGSSVLDVLTAYEKACGKEIARKIVDRRPGDIASCYADTEKAEKLLRWKAKYNISDMCRDSWNFMTKQG